MYIFFNKNINKHIKYEIKMDEKGLSEKEQIFSAFRQTRVALSTRLENSDAGIPLQDSVKIVTDSVKEGVRYAEERFAGEFQGPSKPFAEVGRSIISHIRTATEGILPWVTGKQYREYLELVREDLQHLEQAEQMLVRYAK